MSVPKISCLTITRDRPEMLRRAVESYGRQTWSNKELVVVVDGRGNTEWVEPFFASLGRSDVRHAILPHVEQLGALRNRTLDLAEGELVATWDDDDLYHPRRLEAQAEALLSEGTRACFLSDSLEYFQDSGELFLVRWSNLGLPPSMVSRREGLPRYIESVVDPEVGEKGSDTLVQKEIFRAGKVTLLSGQPFLYTRIYHGGNVWNRWHHLWTAFHLSFEASDLALKVQGLAPRLREYYPFPIPEAVIAKNAVKVPLPEE